MNLLLKAFLLCLFAITPALAQDFTIGVLKVKQPWVPAPPNSAQVAGGYLTITNIGKEPDTLIGGSAAIAGRVEIHEMSHEGGMMRMRELKTGLVIKPNETITLRPGGLHLMLIDLKQQPTVGAPVKGTLVFAKAGTVEIEFKVEPFGTRVPGDGGRTPPAKSSGGGADPHKGHSSGGKH